MTKRRQSHMTYKERTPKEFSLHKISVAIYMPNMTIYGVMLQECMVCSNDQSQRTSLCVAQGNDSSQSLRADRMREI